MANTTSNPETKDIVKVNGSTFIVTEYGECERHGRYPRMGIREGERWPVCIHSSCPLCLTSSSVSKKFSEAAIPPRFLGKRIRNYVAHCPEQNAARDIASWFCRNIEDNLKNGVSLIFSGSTGTGKTHLSVAIASHAIEMGYSAFFTTARAFLRDVKESWGSKTEKESDVLKRYASLDMLVIDEVGVQYGSDAETLILFDLLNERYNAMKSTIVLSNLPVTVTEDERKRGRKTIEDYLSTRLYDRLLEGGGRVVPFTWASYRKGLLKEDETKKGEAA